MAVRAFTDDPQRLLRAIRQRLDDGSVTTWSVDGEGDLTHTSRQWARKAWMRPRVLDDRLLFNIIGSDEEKMTRATYGVYHGRLIQMLMTHFDHLFDEAVATAIATRGDAV